MSLIIPVIAMVAALLTVTGGVWVALGLFRELRNRRDDSRSR